MAIFQPALVIFFPFLSVATMLSKSENISLKDINWYTAPTKDLLNYLEAHTFCGLKKSNNLFFFPLNVTVGFADVSSDSNAIWVLRAAASVELIICAANLIFIFSNGVEFKWSGVGFGASKV